jgi:clan AA aspartic protease (TIGR02281 family)
MNIKYLCPVIICVLAVLCAPVAHADTLYLKNGATLEGIVRSATVNHVELTVSGGTVVFKPGEIERIGRVSAQENALLYQKWQKKREANELLLKKWEKQQALQKQKPVVMQENIIPHERAPDPTLVYFERAGRTGHITVNARLNDDVPVSLLLDTGATLVVLSREIGRRLGYDVETAGMPIKLKMADGSLMQAKYVILQSVRVRDAEVKNVAAAIMVDDNEDTMWQDGILGMSFLKEFNFRVDQEDNKLILEKRVGDEY